MSLNRRSIIGRLAFGVGALFTKGKFAGAAGLSAAALQMDQGTAQARRSADLSIPGRVGGYIRPGTIEIVHQQFELVVVGGGLSGTCAAISAARNGVKVALVHERSMLGGNSSSEVSNFPENSCAFNTWSRESGIIDELYTEERARNWTPSYEGNVNSQWDIILYEWAQRERNLTLFLNTTLREVEMADESRILAIHAAQLGTEKDFIIQAPLFIDCTGNGVLIYRSGAEFRWGREARSEYGEPSAPELASTDIMGSTLFFKARDTGRPIPFKRPNWAAEFATETELRDRDHSSFENGYAWIEVGHPMHWIRDNEAIRAVLLRQFLGVWDHIKNRCTHGDVRERARNFAPDFISFSPYKRESRRIRGDYVLREQDLRDPSVHPDDLAYGVWPIDAHPPGGILNRSHTPPWGAYFSTKADFEECATLPYGIPLRSCYSKNVVNLLAAGRTLGGSYIAFSSTRVLATGAITGQGVGAAAALCKKYNCGPRQVAQSHSEELQQLLLRQDSFIPGVENRDPLDIARTASVSASSESALHFPEGPEFHSAQFPLAQIFPVSSERLEKIELLLKSSTSQAISVRLGLRKAMHVWDFRSDEDLATATAAVPPGHEGYVPFVFNLRTEAGSLYYVHMDCHPELAWSLSSDPPLWSATPSADVKGAPSLVPVGVTPADRPETTKWRPITDGKVFTMRMTPQQTPYGAANVIRGTNRPDRWTNIWISDPERPLPAWIELKLSKPVEFNQVQITFDDNINVRAYLPQFKFPECVKRYEVAVHAAGQWKTVAEAKDNYYRRVVHTFSRVRADRLRITIHETNGAKTANIYEVRIYNEPDSPQSGKPSGNVIVDKLVEEFRTVPFQTL
ncbi:MAG: FAD-dependent oxidoreductase [Acidobacteria bacterium]|nr:FAD-dependent oxidoreductase [Acidobacteriota bacterium]